MNRFVKNLVPSLALLGVASVLPAVELSTALGGRSSDQYLQGSVLFEWILQDNYAANDQKHDQFWLRAELGTKIELEDHMELNIVFAYDGEFGDHSDVTDGNGSNDGEVVLDEGSILFKQFLRPELDVRFGRQPVNWNLRAGFGAFLYDSRANKPDVLSWDGIVANYDVDNVILRPYMYQLEEDNEESGTTAPIGTEDDRNDNMLYGIVIDYEPQHEGDNNIFVSMNFSWEKNVVVDTGIIGNNLATYYIGTEWNMPSGLDFYGEYAKQEGDLDSVTDFDAYGYSVGFNLQMSEQTLFGLQFDTLSGEDSGASYTGFVAPHEGVSDLLIFEHERYGELSEQFVGNMEAIKVRFEWAMTADERVMLKFVAGGLELNRTTAGNDSKLGEEYDLMIDWEYDSRTTLKFFGGYFDPDKGYEDIVGNSNKVQMYGASIEVLF
ncbi:MAG: alginate export family protein [Planctomycetes bacterium]|nr:alginate export family protein [Planctomycetota bacterium]